jgi:hypothetical protein
MRGWRVLAGLAAATALPGCAALWPPFDLDLQAASAPSPAPGSRPGAAATRGGFEAKYVDLAGFSGLVYGARAARALRLDPHWYGGLMAYGTLPVVGKNFAPAFGFGGVQAGWEGKLFGGLHADLGLLAGLTSDMSECSPSPLGRQAILEPTAALGLGLPFPRGGRLSLVVGGLVLPMALMDSGFSVGLRFETKSIAVSVASED